MIDLDRWDGLRHAALSCTRCTLAETRTQVVFGSGARSARLMVIGEAPGAQEDLQGEPFVGRSGQLLTALLASIGLTRDEVYIANVVKCRPPENRDPRPGEVASCRPYLEEQIALVRPAVIVPLGNFATKLLLDTTVGITKLRGQSFPYREGTMVIPTLHPAAVLRGGPAARTLAEADFRAVADALIEGTDR